MAVSKVHPVEAILEAYAAGQRLFGENRVQEFQEKSPHLKDLTEAEFHLIGPLQSNKTTKAAELFDAIDAVDSLKIAQRLNTTAAALGKKLPVLIEVKLSHEESKHGLAPEELPSLLAAMDELESIAAVGLMTVPPWSEDAELAPPVLPRAASSPRRIGRQIPSRNATIDGHVERLHRRHRRRQHMHPDRNSPLPRVPKAGT